MSSAKEIMDDMFATVEMKIDSAMAAADAACKNDGCRPLKRSQAIRGIITDSIRRIGVIAFTGAMTQNVSAETITELVKETTSFIALTDAFIRASEADLKKAAS